MLSIWTDHSHSLVVADGDYEAAPYVLPVVYQEPYYQLDAYGEGCPPLSAPWSWHPSTPSARSARLATGVTTNDMRLAYR